MREHEQFLLAAAGNLKMAVRNISRIADKLGTMQQEALVSEAERVDRVARNLSTRALGLEMGRRNAAEGAQEP